MISMSITQAWPHFKILIFSKFCGDRSELDTAWRWCAKFLSEPQDDAIQRVDEVLLDKACVRKINEMNRNTTRTVHDYITRLVGETPVQTVLQKK